jgi:ABC-type ATPase with predicted acetyltransferase domain
MTTIIDNADVRIVRRAMPANHTLSLLDRIYVERGTKADWDLLHELHYKAERLGIGPKIYRCVLDGQVIGVGVMTVPKMLLSGRNEAMPHMRPNVDGRDTRLINRTRALWLNAHACTNSRLVLDTMYRGAGIAYRMQNLMMRMTGCRYVEFQSSMSKFNPFAAKAGMRFTKPKRSSNYEKGLAFFQRWFESVPMDYVGIKAEIDAMPPAVQTKCIAEMRKFYYTCSSMEKSGDNRANGTTRVDAMAVGYLLKSLQQLVLASPLYGIFENPDFCHPLPARLPLVAFDNQSLGSPLDLEAAYVQMGRIPVVDDLTNPEDEDAPDSQAD